jgi:PAS domain S-box-containing protein
MCPLWREPIGFPRLPLFRILHEGAAPRTLGCPPCQRGDPRPFPPHSAPVSFVSGSPSDISRVLQLIPDLLAGPIVVVDAAGSIRQVNRALEKILGKSEDEVRGRPLTEVMLPDTELERHTELWPRVLSGEITEPLETTLRCAEGRVRTIVWQYTRVVNPDGEVEGIVSTGTDVTALRRLEAQEQALRESEARFSGIVEMASDAIISVDSEQRIVMFNQGASQIFGYTPDEILGAPLGALLPADARTEHRGQIDRFLDSPVVSRAMGARRSIRGLRRDGSEFAAEASIVKLTVAGEVRATVLLRDVSDRVRFTTNQTLLANLEQALAASLDLDPTLDALISAVLPHLADVAIVDLLDDDAGVIRRVRFHGPEIDGPAPILAQGEDGEEAGGTFDGVAPTTREVMDTLEPILLPVLTTDAMAGIAVHPERMARLEPRSAIGVPLIARGRCFGVIYLVRCGPAEPRPGRPFLHLPFDPEDLALAKEIGLRAGMGIDNAKLYRDARRAVDARDEVLGIVSHDLGNPLQAIFIGLEALGRSRPGRTEGRPGQDEYYFTAIRRSAEVMAHLIQDLLEVRRIEAGHLELRPVHQDPVAQVTAALEVLLPLAQVKGIVIRNEIAAGSLPALSMDGARIQQVLSNLIGNAIKHTPEGGTISLRCDTLDRELHFHVEDTGEGIAPKDLERVFDRFWRADRGRVRGIGLGLAIARTLVRAHGGRIWAVSEEGSGSTFSFSLPR